MSTTTQILFNSPALHSLKREQLVKLCKIHAIKANGKNVELIQRLRQHAQTMPKDSPLSIAARSEPTGPIPLQAPKPEEEEGQKEEEMDDPAWHRSRMVRPSEQWEIVMDSIAEVEEGSSQGTLSSQRTVNNGIPGEFGTGSSRSTTVSSSIKALATSLGLKRGPDKFTPPSTASSKVSVVIPPHSIPEGNDELAQQSTPYSALPETTSLPQTDHFTLDPDRMSLDNNPEGVPLPGHTLRPGVPAPLNARLSLGLGLGAPATPKGRTQPTTTIRLVSNPLADLGQKTSYAPGENGTPQLKPFKTTFDISFGSPAPSNMAFGFGSLSSWPPRNDDNVQMNEVYPKLTVNDLPPSLQYTPRKNADAEGDVTMPGSLPRGQALNPPQPFIFGSPNPRHSVSDDQFRAAAASVLKEMNQRLREDGVDELELEIISKLHPSKKAVAPRDIKPIPASKRSEISSKFEKLHEQEFDKMESIDQLLKRRAERSPPKRVGEEEERPVVGKKRKSSVIERPGPSRPSIVASRASATRVISNGRRGKALPGAFMSDDEDEEEEERGGKRVRIDPEAGPSSTEEIKKQEGVNEQRREELAKEKEAIRKKLEANKARRRSSAAQGGLAGRKSGRVSVGRPRPSVLLKPRPKPSRFGFFSSAKTLVQSVWNRGKAPADAASSNIPKPPSNIIKLDTPPKKEKMGPPSLLPAKKAAPAPARSSATVASGSTVPSIRVNNAKQKADQEKGLSSTMTTRGSIASTSSRSRSPIPSFNTSSSKNSVQSNAMSFASGGTRSSRTSSMASPSSRTSSVVGTGTGTTRSRTSSTNVSSMGNRLSNTTRLSAQGAAGSMGSKKVLASGSSSVTSRTSSRISTTTSSRLCAPTASSLAKATRTSGAGLKAVSEDRYSHKALGSITNSPAVATPAASAGPSPAGPRSPRSGAIFSKPLLLPQPSGIPTPVKKCTLSGDTAIAAGDCVSSPTTKVPASPSGAITRGRSLNGRKPRISRSKVIARLASQRAAGARSGNASSGRASGSGVRVAPRASGGVAKGKIRSSLGEKASRASYGGGMRRTSGGAGAGAGGLLMSAKKRARQSEHARRRSRVAPLNFGDESGDRKGQMEVDA